MTTPNKPITICAVCAQDGKLTGDGDACDCCGVVIFDRRVMTDSSGCLPYTGMTTPSKDRAAFDDWWGKETKGQIDNRTKLIAHCAYQAACAEKNKVIAELVKALEAIRTHQETVMKGNATYLSTTWFIANQALTKGAA